MVNKDGTETIKISPTTKKRLMKMARYAESIDSIISRLLDSKTVEVVA